MEIRANFLALCLLDALEDEEERVVHNILDKYKVDPSFVQQERGIAPLHYSCGMPNHKRAFEITQRFLQCNNVNVNVRTVDNMTPIHVAAMYGRVDIVRLLLEYGAKLDIVDNDRKTPVLYAIEECHFDVVQLMRDHIFEEKYEKTLQKVNKYSNAMQNKENSLSRQMYINHKNLLPPTTTVEQNKYTPNKIHYNYDVTSPYYINITHRRHKTQPMFPAEETIPKHIQTEPVYIEDETTNSEEDNLESNYVEKTTNSSDPLVNLFTLTEENLRELSRRGPLAESTRTSLIEAWRDKVQRSRTRASIIKEFDNVDEMIDSMMQSSYLNFTNTTLLQNNDEVNSSSDGETSISPILQNSPSTKNGLLTHNNKLNDKPLGGIIQKVVETQIIDLEPETDTSYGTAPELRMEIAENNNNLQVPNTISSDPPNDEYIMQMTEEAYIHTDSESGLVFYEKKLVRTSGNKMAKQRVLQQRKSPDHDTTVTSQSTNYTLPIDYETDALRKELTHFGEPPGPITKSTKHLYIKRLIKYKRKTAAMMEQQQKNDSKILKFSVELYRTIRSPALFQQITELMKYDVESSKFFANNENKKMREGHLKQSFIYMLIDPRISSNLPAECEFLDRYLVWRRFLQSIFYVGKGKTSRPYSHLYDAMKTYSRIDNNNGQIKQNNGDKKTLAQTIRRQPVNAELFREPTKKASSDSKKLDRILDIWRNGNGVVCLHVFHNIVPSDAYTREAAIIEALSLQHLTNLKRGDFYGPAKTWTMKEKKYLGIALLFKAMQIFLAEGESQLSPSDLI